MVLSPVKRFFEAIGSKILSFIEQAGGMVMLAMSTFAWMFRLPLRLGLWFHQMNFVGVGSLFIVMLTGTFTGMVFALQTVSAFARFNAESLVGGAVALALTREMAPVLASMMVTARAGSAMAAELGTMKVTEQVDALVTMAVNPVQYLVVPRVIASTLMLPLLTVLFDFVGMLGAYAVAVYLMGVDEGAFVQNIEKYLQVSDIMTGIVKAGVFGFILSIISCYKGINTSGGARGVGEATTMAVVMSSVSIFIADYILTEFMY